MLESGLVVNNSSKCYTSSTVFFHKDEGYNVVVTNLSHIFLCLSHPNPKELGLFYVIFQNFPIIYPVVPVYYLPGHPSNTISQGDLKMFIGFQKVTSEPLEHCNFMHLQSCSWRRPYRAQKILDYLHIEVVRVNPTRNKDIVIPTICGLSEHNIQ